MELNITEIDDIDNFNEFNNVHLDSQFEYEKIPENTVPVPIKVIKKGVHFTDNTVFPQKPTHQTIPKVNAKITRPQMPPQKPKISYEDILSKLGMLVSNGKLHLIDRNTLTPQQQQILNSQSQQSQYQQSMDDTNIPQNSYIYNKYFKDDVKPQNNLRRPRSLHEYKMMLVDDYIQRHRIKQMKSTKLVMPTSNINIAKGHSGNLNKLFDFSKR
jgi:hypothetical protein